MGLASDSSSDYSMAAVAAALAAELTAALVAGHGRCGLTGRQIKTSFDQALAVASIFFRKGTCRNPALPRILSDAQPSEHSQEISCELSHQARIENLAFRTLQLSRLDCLLKLGMPASFDSLVRSLA